MRLPQAQPGAGGWGICSAANAGRALTFVDIKMRVEPAWALGGGGEVTSIRDVRHSDFYGITVSDLLWAGPADITVVKNT